MRCLITGGCGFLGSNLAAALIRTGHDVAIMDNLSREGSRANLAWLRDQGAIHHVNSDVRLSDACDAIVASVEPDIVFHLAGQVAMTTSLERPRMDFEINALGTLNMLEAVRAHRPTAGVIYSSTNKVYGDLRHLRIREDETRYSLPDYPMGLPETVALDFHSPYGCSKGCADQYMLDYARMFGLRTVVFRHSSMYGGRQFSTADQGWIGWFCAQAVRQASGDVAPFTISGDGKQVRDVLHADDMVALYITAAAQLDRIAGRAFNIGGGAENSLSLLELMGLLEEIVARKLRWTHVAARDSDQRVFVADLRRIHSGVGWVPRVGKREGVQRMVEWVRNCNASG